VISSESSTSPGIGSQVRALVRPPFSRRKPAKRSLLGKRPFLPGLWTAWSGLFGLQRN
jgi:hypothetical protein